MVKKDNNNRCLVLCLPPSY